MRFRLISTILEPTRMTVTSNVFPDQRQPASLLLLLSRSTVCSPALVDVHPAPNLSVFVSVGSTYWTGEPFCLSV